MKSLLFILLSLVLLASGQELVLNGDFESGLDSWETDINNNQGSYDVSTCTTYHPDPGYEVRVYKYMCYHSNVNQLVAIPNTDVGFRCAARLLASKGPTSGHYAYSMVSIEYITSRGGTLGRTMFANYVGDFYPENTPWQHVMRVTDTEWHDYEFVIADELRNNLTGINPVHVAAVRVVLESFGTGTSG